MIVAAFRARMDFWCSSECWLQSYTAGVGI